MVQIREIAEQDNEQVASVIRNVFDEFEAPKEGTVYSDPSLDNLYLLFDKPGAVLWIAEENGDMLGCCGIFPTDGLPPGTCELVKFYLSAGARGRGTGEALMDKCLESARFLGYRQVYLESIPLFKNAVSLYLKKGFIHLPKALGNSGHFSCDIWMLKQL